MFPPVREHVIQYSSIIIIISANLFSVAPISSVLRPELYLMENPFMCQAPSMYSDYSNKALIFTAYAVVELC